MKAYLRFWVVRSDGASTKPQYYDLKFNSYDSVRGWEGDGWIRSTSAESIGVFGEAFGGKVLGTIDSANCE